FDPASPITTFATSNNGEEEVATESAVVSLTSSFANVISHARVQFSRDLQQSRANSDYVYTRIRQVLDGFGRASILPRRTNEHKVHAAETVSLDSGRHAWKFGGDAVITRITNFFPAQFGGEYIFDSIHVNPWTFEPMSFGMDITPLRAYAHQVPRYYLQNFGSANSHPDTNEWAAFAQDTIRLSNRFALSLGLRYDLQTFRGGLLGNSSWPQAGRVPRDSNNFAPRAGFAWSLGEQRALVVRGGYGMFYTRIPSIYTSTIETDNGVNSTHLLLDNGDQNDQALFPQYPNPLAACGLAATTCAAPASVAGRVTTEISSFARDFRTPMVQQASLGVEREIADRFAISANYMYVHGEHLIRARDVNLPEPHPIAYPLFDSTGTTFTGDYYTVNSFGTWEMLPTFGCSYPPCLNDVVRPISQVGAINVFESAASSVYHGLTISARRRMSRGLYFRLAYTFARAMDDGQDALVAGRPVVVQNSYSTAGERGPSVTDQRHRLVASWVAAPQPFHRDHPALALLFNNWSLAGVITFGSGRPINARILGDANRDGNDANDRLPGYRRNSFTGPDYATTDLRLTRRIYAGDRLQLELSAESFNLFNRNNQRVQISDDGFLNSAGTFVPGVVVSQGRRYAASYRQSQGFLQPTNAYAPRQVQLALRLRF
ncbi:MAG TPA: TonB-dependent receptor, partial [Terriglobales bacterium]|nr:TonB-dependent receptor [Terriglobales bacterium]